jgi:hypothetical protein
VDRENRPEDLAEGAARLCRLIEDDDTEEAEPIGEEERAAILARAGVVPRPRSCTPAHGLALVASAVVRLGGVLLVLCAVALTSCGLTVREVATASLEAANAAIVAAARDVDSLEAIDEQHCAHQQACIAAARARWNPALEAYDGYRVAWALLVGAWNRSAPQPELDAAAAQVRAAEATFYAAKAQARAVSP